MVNIISHKLKIGTSVTISFQNIKISFGLALANQYYERRDVLIIIWNEPQIKLKWFYRKHTLSTTIEGQKFIIEYHRTPFWTNEKPTLKLFLQEKANSWHGNVWKVMSNGSKIAAGFGYNTYCKRWFPRKYMRAFLNYQAKDYIRVTK